MGEGMGRGKQIREGEIPRFTILPMHAWTVIVSGILGNDCQCACDDASPRRGAEWIARSHARARAIFQATST